ncbi:MAG: nucleotidyltransferase domain-containing protein [bacterium]
MAVARHRFEPIPLATIQAYVAEIVAMFHPQKVLLFGSYAYESPRKGSDVDLLVLMEHEAESWSKAAEIRLALKSPFPLDLIVLSPDRFAAMCAEGSSFAENVMEDAVVLYDANHSPTH